VSLSYDCLIDLGQRIENEDEALEAEKGLRSLFEHIRENDGPDAMYSHEDGECIYDVSQLTEWATECQDSSGDPDDMAVFQQWLKHLEVLQKHKIYLIWVSW